MFEDTSVTTSNDLHFSSFNFTISHNGAFFIRFALTIPVAATPIALKCLNKAALAKIIVRDIVIIEVLRYS